MCVYRELEGEYFAMRLALFGERDMQGHFSNDVYGGRTLCSVPAQRIFTFVAFAAQVCMDGGLGNSVSEVTCTEAFCFR